MKERLFDPLLILYICPLTKKLSVYNFNGSFIWTVRDRITTKKSRNMHKKSYKLICILMSDKYLTPSQNMTWWQNTCWQSQRSDVSCSWPPGLHTSQSHSSLQIFSKSLRFRGWRLVTRTFSSLRRFFYVIKVWRLLGHSRTLTCLFLSHSFVAIAVCFGCFDATWPSIIPLMWCSCPVPFSEKHLQSIMFPPPCLTVGMVFLGS